MAGVDIVWFRAGAGAGTGAGADTWSLAPSAPSPEGVASPPHKPGSDSQTSTASLAALVWGKKVMILMLLVVLLNGLVVTLILMLVRMMVSLVIVVMVMILTLVTFSRVIGSFILNSMKERVERVKWAALWSFKLKCCLPRTTLQCVGVSVPECVNTCLFSWRPRRGARSSQRFPRPSGWFWCSGQWLCPRWRTWAKTIYYTSLRLECDIASKW